MIKFRNKTYSLNHDFKEIRSHHRQNYSQIYHLFLSNHSNSPYPTPQTNKNITYVSPQLDYSKINNFLHSTSINNRSVNISKSQLMNTHLTTNLKQHLRSKSFHIGNQNHEKSKNIREYFSKISQNKKRYNYHRVQSKSQQVDSLLGKQQNAKNNPHLIIKKVSNRLRHAITYQHQQKDIFRIRETPIHHTQIFYFSKKHPKTQPIFLDGDQSQTMTVNDIRLKAVKKYEQNINQKQGEQFVQDEIHPTIAIITTRKQLRISENKQRQDKQRRQKMTIMKVDGSVKQQQISPWNRKNHQQNEFISI